MNDSVLIPVNGLQPTIAALNHVLTLEGDREITILHVCPIVEREESIRKTVLPEAIDEQRDASSQTADQVFAKARSYADDHGVTLRTVATSGNPANQISSYGAAHDISRIVIGSENQSLLSRILRGSLPEAVMRASSVPVTAIEVSDDESDTSVGSVGQNQPLTISRGIN